MKTSIKIVLLLIVCFTFCVGYADDNLIKNYNFEGQNNWKASSNGTSKAEITSGGYRSKRCGYINKVRDGKSTIAAIEQSIIVNDKQKYQLCAMVKGRGHLFGYCYDKNNKYLGGTSGIKFRKKDWSNISCVEKMLPGTVKFTVRFELYGEVQEGRGWIDNVYFGSPLKVPEKISDFSVKVDSNNKVRLSWKNSPQDKYKLFYSQYPNFVGEDFPVFIVKGNSYQTSIPSGWKRCYYQIKTVNKYGMTGPPSKILLATNKKLKNNPRALVTTYSSLEKLKRYSSEPENIKTEICLEQARNEAEAAQIIVFAIDKKLPELNAKITSFKKNGKTISEKSLKANLFWVRYSKVIPTITGKQSGLMPDALIPIKKPVNVPLDANQAIWVSVKASTNCPPGSYLATVKLSSNDKFIQEVPVRVKVYDFKLPVTPSQGSSFEIWKKFLAIAYNLKINSPAFLKMHEKYYWFLIERRLAAGSLPVLVESSKALKYLKSPKIPSIRIPSLWENINQINLEKRVKILKSHNRLKDSFIYCFDEPEEKDYSRFVNLAIKIRAVSKDIKIILTEQPEKELYGSVDIWCPRLDYVDLHELEQRQAAGDIAWWYTCLDPQVPYPTYLIDDDGISHRVLSWLQFKYNIRGILYWGVNIWSKYRNKKYSNTIDVWNESELFPGANGDGFLVYPGPDGPLSTIRLEIIRDGNEDYEYLALLRKKLKSQNLSPQQIDSKISEIISPVAQSLKKWSKKTELLKKQRKIIANILQED